MDKKVLKPWLTELTPLPTGLKPQGSVGNEIRCILFDIYGTLFISSSGDIGTICSKPDRLDLLQDLLGKFEIQIPVESLIDSYIESIKNAHTKSRREGIDIPEVDILQIWNSILKLTPLQSRERVKHFAIEFEQAINPVFPMPGLKKCLQDCRSRNLQMGIISNAQFYTPLLFDFFLGSSLQELGFNPDLILFSYQFGIAKPSPALFKTARERIKKIGLENRTVLYVGNDMLNDILPSHRIGFKTGLFAGDARSLRLRESIPECRSLKPDLILTHLDQLL
jgi:putative hydrolase of the HAD superfamily